jgi:hypothetical protein
MMLKFGSIVSNVPEVSRHRVFIALRRNFQAALCGFRRPLDRRLEDGGQWLRRILRWFSAIHWLPTSIFHRVKIRYLPFPGPHWRPHPVPNPQYEMLRSARRPIFAIVSPIGFRGPRRSAFRTGFESRKNPATGGIDLNEFGALSDTNPKQAQARRTEDRSIACVLVRCDDVFSIETASPGGERSVGWTLRITFSVLKSITLIPPSSSLT